MEVVAQAGRNPVVPASGAAGPSRLAFGNLGIRCSLVFIDHLHSGFNECVGVYHAKLLEVRIGTLVERAVIERSCSWILRQVANQGQ